MLQLILSNLGAIVPVVFAGLAVGLVWGIRKLGLKKELEEAIEQFTHRVLDKCQEWLGVALAPDSDGGASITAAEMSQIRQKAWDMLKEELHGPLAKLLLAWGENRVKGLIGSILASKGIVITNPPAGS